MRKKKLEGTTIVVPSSFFFLIHSTCVGEDRMLCTLLIQNGWMLQYCSTAEARTYCPDNFREFFIQRRRWITSTLANLYHLLGCADRIVQANNSISMPFILYIYAAFLSSLCCLATVVLVVLGGLINAVGYSGWVYVFAVGIPLVYTIICAYFNIDMSKDSASLKIKKANLQIQSAYFICCIYVLIMIAVLVGTLVQMVTQPTEPDSLYLFALAFVFILTGILHDEWGTLLCGLVYLILLPTMYLVLMIYAIANMHDQSWGTRENPTLSEKGEELFNLKDFGIAILVKLGIRDKKNEEKESLLVKEKEEPKQSPPLVAPPPVHEEDVRLPPLKSIKKEDPRKPALRQLHSFLKKAVQVKSEDARITEEKKEERIQELAKLKNGSALLILLANASWVVLIVVLDNQPSLQVLNSNAVGLGLLIAVSLVLFAQFTGMILHRIGTLLTFVASIPLPKLPWDTSAHKEVAPILQTIAVLANVTEWKADEYTKTKKFNSTQYLLHVVSMQKLEQSQSKEQIP